MVRKLVFLLALCLLSLPVQAGPRDDRLRAALGACLAAYPDARAARQAILGLGFTKAGERATSAFFQSSNYTVMAIVLTNPAGRMTGCEAGIRSMSTSAATGHAQWLQSQGFSGTPKRGPGPASLRMTEQWTELTFKGKSAAIGIFEQQNFGQVSLARLGFIVGP
ncbi:hypothetical protein [Mesobacterium pallidum]|uniref:hypothetical protein n=1 Tax=Mesobacterium pallidum TaxID=2872037 RepID=UPI001EE32F09|nr:hypothetical protein [Mesobacterium pallidum]